MIFDFEIKIYLSIISKNHIGLFKTLYDFAYL
jgi:hypothetical protein